MHAVIAVVDVGDVEMTVDGAVAAMREVWAGRNGVERAEQSD
jgi:hypothetical protein